MNSPPRAIEPPLTVIPVDGAPRRQVVRQMPPRAAGAIEIKYRIEHLAQVDRSGPAAELRRWDQRLDQSPLTVRHVGLVWHPVHTLSIGSLR